MFRKYKIFRLEISKKIFKIIHLINYIKYSSYVVEIDFKSYRINLKKLFIIFIKFKPNFE